MTSTTLTHWADRLIALLVAALPIAAAGFIANSL